MARKARLTRELVDRLPRMVEDQGPMTWTVDDAHYPQTAAELMAELPADGQLWVFAIGSLIWNPRMPVAETRPAVVRGWRRSFCLGPDERYRGNPAAPGLMLSLVRGGQARGVVLRMAADDMACSLEALLRKEPPLKPSWVRAKTPQGPVSAIAFTLPLDHARCVEGLCETEVADRLASAVGTVGSMADYLLNTVSHLADAGIRDRYLSRMEALVAERLERLPPA